MVTPSLEVLYESLYFSTVFTVACTVFLYKKRYETPPSVMNFFHNEYFFNDGFLIILLIFQIQFSENDYEVET